MSKKPAPSEVTSKLLRDYLKSFSEGLPFLNPSVRSTPLATNLLSLAILSVDKDDPNYGGEKLKPFRDLIHKNESDLKYAIASLEILKKILDSDSHLKVCCDRPFNLAYILDEYFLQYIYQLCTLSIKINQEQFEIMYAELISILYEESYSRNAFFHLYNFECEEKIIEDVDFVIKELDQLFIPKLLGEKGAISQFHASGIGNYFIHYADKDFPNDYPGWIDRKHHEARRILTLLQLLQDGIIDIDYFTVFFTPNFVNKIWRFGNFYYGDIKKTTRANKYLLSKDNISTLLLYRKVQRMFAGRIENANSQLGKVLTLAERHYANFHSKEIIVEQLLDLIISLESLYSPDDKIELSHRIRLYAGIFLGNQIDSRDVYDFLNEMLKKRGALVHGGYDIREVEEGRFISDDNIMKLASIVRLSILSFIVLYLKGENSREQVHKMIQDAAFYNEKFNELKDAIDLDKFLQDVSK